MQVADQYSGYLTAPLISALANGKMKKYILLIIVLVASIALTYATNQNDYLHSIAQYPAITALLGIMGMIILDEMKYQKEIRKAELTAITSMFAGTYYASQVYNRQINFCEEYWRRALSIVRELYTRAEFPELVESANSLYSFRIESAIWLTEEINEGLEGFEKALRYLGVHAHVYDQVVQGGKNLPGVTEGIEDKFTRILAIGKHESKPDDQNPDSYLTVLKELQKVLGISELYEYRKKVMGNSR